MSTIVGRNDARTRHRFLVCSLSLVATLLSTMSRIVLNVSITSMIDAELLEEEGEISTFGSCPSKSNFVRNPRQDTSVGIETGALSEGSNSQLNSSRSGHSELLDKLAEGLKGGESIENRYDWSFQEQSTLLGGFYYSYFVFIIIGGRLAEVHGSKHVLLVAMGGTAIIHLATPWLASQGIGYLTGARMTMGALQSGVFPAQYDLFSKWLTMSEASIYTPMIKMNMKIGALLGSLLPGLFKDWSHVFYFSGFVGTIWSIAWFFLATSDPRDNYWVSEEEVKHIDRKKSQDESTIGKNPLSWMSLLTSPAVLVLALSKLTLNSAVDFLNIEIPTYLKYIHNASKLTICTIATCLALIQVVALVLVGWLSKLSINKQPFGLSKTCIRRIFQGVGNFGQFIIYLLIASNTCDLASVAVLFQLAGLTISFSAGGDLMLPYDLSSEYVATIAAFSSSLANASSVAMTSLTGFVIGKQGKNYKRWNIVIITVALANLVGGLAFCSMVKAESIDYKLRKKDKSAVDNVDVQPTHSA